MKYKTKVVPLSSIVVEGRYREDMGNIDELAAAIQDKGLLQPICVDSDMHLLAGGRRHAACTKLGLKEIPVLIRESEDELDAREVELMENIHRKDMTWQEQAKLTARIHELHAVKNPSWSGQQTANLLETSRMDVSRALRLAAGLEALPALAECKTADDAHKVMKKAEEDAIVAEMARRQLASIKKVEDNHAASPKERGLAAMLKVARENYVVGDVFQHLANMRAGGHIDFIECDPPYGIDLAKVASREDGVGADTRQRDESYNEIPAGDYPDFLKRLAPELFRVAGRDCWMIFWFAFQWHGVVKEELEKAGWQVDTVPALWHKGNGRTPRPDILLARAYEPFFVCRKGQPRLIRQGQMNIWIRNADEKKYHPAQRPVGLLKDIIETFLDGMKSILVPFAGSGATLRAAYQMGHKVIGFDNNGEYKDKFLLAVEEDTKRELSKE